MTPRSDRRLLPRPIPTRSRKPSAARAVLAVGVLLLLAPAVPACSEDRNADRGAPAQAAAAARYLVTLSGRDVHDVVASWPTTALPPALERRSSIPIPSSQDLALDGLRYRIIEDPEGDRFWVEVSGGFAGVLEYRGPARIDEDGSWVLLEAEDGGDETRKPGT